MRSLYMLAFALLVLRVCEVQAKEGCVDPKNLSSAVGRLEVPHSRASEPDWQATGWFNRSNQEVVTNEHVVKLSNLSQRAWSPIFFVPTAVGGYSLPRVSMYARVLIQDRRRDLAILTLSAPLGGVALLRDIDPGPIDPKSPLTLLGYGSNRFQIGTATLHTRRPNIADYVSEGKLALDVRGEENLDAFTGGSSGGPIVNCKGAVVGVAATLEGYGMTFVPNTNNKTIRPPANMFPNVYPVAIQHLENLYFSLNRSR